MTKETQFFSLPPGIEKEAVSALIGAIPDNWSWVNGYLLAPQTLLATGEAVKDTGLTFKDHSTICPIFVGEQTKGEFKQPDLRALYVEGRLPHLVYLQQAGLHGGMITVKLAKAIADRYIKLGYTGWLMPYLGFDEIYIDNNQARAKICWGESPRGWGPNHPLNFAAVRAVASKNGQTADVSPILEQCRRLNLVPFEADYEL